MLIILNYYTMYIRIKTSHVGLQMSTIHIISMTKISIFFSVINISNRVEFLYVMCTEAHIHFLSCSPGNQTRFARAGLLLYPPPAIALATTAAWAPAVPLSLRYTMLSVVLH